MEHIQYFFRGVCREANPQSLMHAASVRVPGLTLRDGSPQRFKSALVHVCDQAELLYLPIGS